MRDDVRTRFLREGYVANSVKHPGAVLVVDDDRAEDGTAFLVMELLRGLAVEQLWEKHGGRLSPQAVTFIGYELLDVLAAAHSRSIVHRDIKPANVFVTNEGALKVLDFGIAQLKSLAATGNGMATQNGMLLGTPAFMAPEQAIARTDEIGPHSDLWAVGATLFTLLSGRLVHEAGNASHLLILAGTSQARPLASVAPQIPAPIAEVIDRALAFDRRVRWPDAGSMRHALREASLAVFHEPPSRNAVLDLLGRPALEQASTARPSQQCRIRPSLWLCRRPYLRLRSKRSRCPIRPHRWRAIRRCLCRGRRGRRS